MHSGLNLSKKFAKWVPDSSQNVPRVSNSSVVIILATFSDENGQRSYVLSKDGMGWSFSWTFDKVL